MIDNYLKNISKKLNAELLDLDGNPYYLHLNEVNNNLLKLSKSNKFNLDLALIIGEFHDIISNNLITIEDFKDHLLEATIKDSLPVYFVDKIIYGIELLTFNSETSYAEYIINIKKSDNNELIFVKVADLMSDMNVSRLTNLLDEFDLLTVKKYHLSYLYLMDKISQRKFTSEFKKLVKE